MIKRPRNKQNTNSGGIKNNSSAQMGKRKKNQTAQGTTKLWKSDKYSKDIATGEGKSRNLSAKKKSEKPVEKNYSDKFKNKELTFREKRTSGKPTAKDYSDKFKNKELGYREKRTSGKPDLKAKKTQKKNAETNKFLRLNKYISNSGICARREADELISGGFVTVNGEKITQLGTKVTYSDQVKVRGKLIMPEKKVYVLLNKPKDYITTLDDPYAKKTVVQLVREACPERIYPVGRLDKNTTGVLLFTNDGELAKKLTHPSSEIPKIYQVKLDNPLTKAHLQEISKGIILNDGPVTVDEISYFDDLDSSQVGVQIHSGRNRIVRRIFEHLGYKVIKLDRVYFAGLTKSKLPRGKWRFLNEKEITRLKMNIFK